MKTPDQVLEEEFVRRVAPTCLTDRRGLRAQFLLAACAWLYTGALFGVVTLIFYRVVVEFAALGVLGFLLHYAAVTGVSFVASKAYRFSKLITRLTYRVVKRVREMQKVDTPDWV